MSFQFNGRKIEKGDCFIWGDDKKIIYKIEDIYEDCVKFTWVYKNREHTDSGYSKDKLIKCLRGGGCKFYEIKIYYTKLAKKLYPNSTKKGKYILIKGDQNGKLRRFTTN